ncbi:MAG: hypothetical protein ABIG46_05845 [Candidatus Omnitrophota bacterium]
MGLVNCPECSAGVSEKAIACPKCGHALNISCITSHFWRGFEYKSKAEMFGWPLIHIAFAGIRRREDF